MIKLQVVPHASPYLLNLIRPLSPALLSWEHQNTPLLLPPVLNHQRRGGGIHPNHCREAKKGCRQRHIKDPCHLLGAPEGDPDLGASHEKRDPSQGRFFFRWRCSLFLHGKFLFIFHTVSVQVRGPEVMEVSLTVSIKESEANYIQPEGPLETRTESFPCTHPPEKSFSNQKTLQFEHQPSAHQWTR